MWITQTYLGTAEANAKLFVYYFYEDYVDSETLFTERLQREFKALGDVFGDKVSLMMPNPRYAGSIEAEVREIRLLWEALKPKLPGLFLSTVPLSQVRGYDEWCFFVPFDDTRVRSGVRDAVQTIRSLADEAIEWNYKKNAEASSPTIVDRFFEAIEIKPGIGGLKIDLKRLFSR